MKYIVGYQLTDSNNFVDYIIENRRNIYEVYFSFANMPNGRNNQLINKSYSPWEAQARMLSDIKRISDAGIKLNLLLNGNCYGKDSLSRALFQKIGEMIDYFLTEYTLDSVTTSSPIIAKFVKNNFENIEVRASVNMEIGTVIGMDYISDYFDGYYMKRELNRNLPEIARLKSWCVSHGKKLYLLANSGCLNNCSAHTFHDNLVSHETEISAMDNAYEFHGICSDYLKQKENRVSVIRDMNYVRPEDIDKYKPYFEAVKLATRVHPNPVAVLRAYLNRKYSGNILDILEPQHSGVLYPGIIDNGSFPDDYCDHIINCDKRCESCTYCSDVLNKTFFELNGGATLVNE